MRLSTVFLVPYRRACLLLAAALIALPLASSRADDWHAERTRLVAAAQQEGAITFFSQPNLAARNFIASEWAKAYPDIKLSITATPGAQIVGRIRIERQSQKYLWDIIMTGSVIGFGMTKEGFTDPFLPELRDPDVNQPAIWGGWDQALVDNAKTYVFSPNLALKSPVYNALKLSPDKVAKEGLQILFDPALKGKIYWHEPGVPGPGQQFAFYLARRFSDDDLCRFIVDTKAGLRRRPGPGDRSAGAWLGLAGPRTGQLPCADGALHQGRRADRFA